MSLAERLQQLIESHESMDNQLSMRIPLENDPRIFTPTPHDSVT